ncbi:MAG: restriction endonuclease subunit S [Deltaproteobacteria bacterium]|nr:restriction endonuclease subunit S [Deltaproteobacteria bacterium]
MIDLAPVHLKTVKRILGQHVPDCEVRAFGSRVTWTAKDYSDLDLAIVASRALDRDTLRRLKEAFEESDLPIRVDVIDYHAISESFRKIVDDNYEVIQTGKVRDSKSKQPNGTFAVEEIHAGRQTAAVLRDLLVTTKDGDWGRDSAHIGYVPYRVIRGTDFPAARIGDISSIPIRYLSEATVLRRTLKPNDILLETAGGSPGRPTGRTLLITEKLLSYLDLPATCASFARFLRVDSDKADPRYIYWFLQCLYASGQMEEHQVQHTGVARFQYTKFAESQRIPLPPLPEQRAIAHILGTLDDKIELNRRTNETLEAMARALFKSWFVDFDPVRAKAARRQPTGMDADTAKLFPSAFVDSELGEIPKGWRATTLGVETERCGGTI